MREKIAKVVFCKQVVNFVRFCEANLLVVEFKPNSLIRKNYERKIRAGGNLKQQALNFDVEVDSALIRG